MISDRSGLPVTSASGKAGGPFGSPSSSASCWALYPDSQSVRSVMRSSPSKSDPHRRITKHERHPCRSRSQRQCSPRRRSKLHIVRFRPCAKAYSFRGSSSPTRNRFAGLQVGTQNGDGDAVPYAVLILNRQFHKQRQRAESNS